ncbi:MAG: hypothetical protein LH702_01555 [Phormidesmis sp. CAN_BIN44]|nr:hypothetical protein [Phormidesmis sp. CAN_BIN44]
MTLPNVHPKRMADEHLLPAALLETGDTLNFLEVRKHCLRNKIKESKLSAATGKVSGLSALASGGLLYFTLANPLGALLACGGLAAYGLAVGAQWLQTGKLHPFPLSSKTSDESDEELSASTLTGGGLQIARSHIHEEASYLEPREKAEYELLHHAPQGLLNAVGSVAPAQRWACYCFLLDAHMTGTLDDYRDRATLETVLGNSSVYHSHLPEAQERFPEIGLDSATVPSLPAANDALPTATSSQIGPTTKFGAIEVPTSPAAQDDSIECSPVQTQTSNQAPTALSALLTSPFLSRAWFGAQRTGKSHLAAVASLELSKRGIKIFHLNLASFGDEDATYWQHAVKSVRADLSSLDEMIAQSFIDSAIALVHEFFQTRNAILIFDEITLTGSLSNQHSSALDPLLRLVADKTACLASTGTKRAQAIWTLSPDFVAGALSQQTKAVKSLALVFVAITPGRSVDWNGNRIGFHAESFGNVQRNFPVLTMPSSNAGCDRICFVDGRWLPVGELPSLEDSKPLKQAVKPNARQQLEAAFKASTPDQEAPQSDSKSNISKPHLPAKDLMLAIAMLAEWMEENLDVEAEKIYEKYNARRKGFSRPEIRFLLTQIENLNAP